MMTAGSVIHTELRKKRHMFDCVHALVKFESVSLCAIET